MCEVLIQPFSPHKNYYHSTNQNKSLRTFREIKRTERYNTGFRLRYFTGAKKHTQKQDTYTIHNTRGEETKLAQAKTPQKSQTNHDCHRHTTQEKKKKRTTPLKPQSQTEQAASAETKEPTVFLPWSFDPRAARPDSRKTNATPDPSGPTPAAGAKPHTDRRKCTWHCSAFTQSALYRTLLK